MNIDINESDTIAVFGSGSLARKCVMYLRRFARGPIYVFEMKSSRISVLARQIANQEQIFYSLVDSSIEERVLKIKPRIVFSIVNNYIFKETLTSRFPIINYHNALLPLHPGRNAEAWAIFSQDKVTGITWHFVENKVDAGNIILQRELPVDDRITSIQLLSRQSELAFETFKLLAAELFQHHKLDSREQAVFEKVKFHFSWERPNDGFLNTDWDFKKASAFLRAMDYGKFNTLGEPKLIYGGAEYTWDKYDVEISDDVAAAKMNLDIHRGMLSGDGCSIRLRGFRKIM